MALHTPVLSETEPTSFQELVNDSREVRSVLGKSVVDLTAAVTQVPLTRMPFSFGTMPVEITDDLLVTVNGMDDY